MARENELRIILKRKTLCTSCKSQSTTEVLQQLHNGVWYDVPKVEETK